MRRKMLLVSLCLVLILIGSAQAQWEQDLNDFGAADSIDLVVSVIPDAATNQLQVQMDLYFFNDANNLGSAGVGFTWDNPNLQMDSAAFTPLAVSAFNFLRYMFYKNNVDSTNAYHRFQFSGAYMDGNGLVANPAPQHVASYYFTMLSWTAADSILIDTLAFSGGTQMKFVDVDLHQYVPFWTGRELVRDTAYSGPSNLLVSEDTLFFSATVGESSPAAQTFNVTSDNEALNFDLVENATWILVYPSSSTTPQTVSVTTPIAGLSAGVYFDSVMIDAPGAENSPQFVYVQLDLQNPPPTIGVSENAFYFTAVADGANPPEQILTITNIGESVLNWTVSNSEMWLNLFPSSGTDSGDVTLTVDITGLPYDDYFDTVVVSDPNATNDPVRIPVKLSVVSSLPVIDVDSVYHWVITISECPEFTRTFEVRNGGGGDLDFWVEWGGFNILDVTPDSSVAPDLVDVLFRIAPPPSGTEMHDTVWVYSNSAVNSPVPVHLYLRFVTEPAVIVVEPDTVVLNVYECDQGYQIELPTEEFEVSNGGGDNTMKIRLDWESDLFLLETSQGLTAPQSYVLTGLETGLPIGTYYDTIMISSQWAVNSPQTLIVQYNSIPGDVSPKIIFRATDIPIPYQANTGPQPHWKNVFIYNVYGGCMEWFVNEDLDWWYPEDTTGNVPYEIEFLVFAENYELGEYLDSFLVVAPEAANSPQWVKLRLQVWYYHGDVDWSGVIDISDVTLLVDFLFGSGQYIPRPYLLVGDCDCDDFVDIGDLTRLIDHLWISMGPICGNPE